MMGAGPMPRWKGRASAKRGCVSPEPLLPVHGSVRRLDEGIDGGLADRLGHPPSDRGKPAGAVRIGALASVLLVAIALRNGRAKA